MRILHPRDRVAFVVPPERTGMVAFSFSLFSFITILCSLTLLVQPSSSSSTTKTSPCSLNLNNFDPDVDLFGDAHVVAEGVSLTRSSPSSSGLLLRRTPITFSSATAYLSAEFSFSISPAAGDGLVLLLVPGDFAAAFPGNDSFGLSQQQNRNNNYVAVEFDTSKDDNVNEPNNNHVGIDVGSLVSVAIANVSDSNLVLNNGEKLNAWVDYVAGRKNLEVRLCKLGEKRPVDPIVSHSIDLVKVWGGEGVFVGLRSSNNGDSVQVVSVYSWKVVGLKGLHSEPVDPRGLSDGHVAVDEDKWGFGPLSVLAKVIFGTGCVALVTFVVLFMWVIFFQRREEDSLGKIPDNPAEIRYERIDVAVDKNTTEEAENLNT